ncbi:MAG: hypothetical protein CSB47_10775 [Proteobacteria bacterium]|nr:MAG: hypothetical protein CSB47_10775 [Pseudomonadota bacterium]
MTKNTEPLANITQQIEDLMVMRDLRGMKRIQQALTPGYYQRAAEMLYTCRGTILIGTGFPVDETFETDGPVGAIALYDTLKHLGADPIIVCGDPLARVIREDYRVYQISVGDLSKGPQEGAEAIQVLKPDIILSIERPGLTADGIYANMRGEDISQRCACFDYFMREATCPTIAIGDGGNEIGMGNVTEALAGLSITPSVTTCDELLVADVSNWGAHGLIALLGLWSGEDLLAKINTLDILKYISARGSVDGVTRLNTLTEDSLESDAGQQVIDELRRITGF